MAADTNTDANAALLCSSKLLRPIKATPNPTTTVLKTKATRVRVNSLAATNKATKVRANSMEATSRAAVIKGVVIRDAATRVVTIKAAAVAEDATLASTAYATPRFIV